MKRSSGERCLFFSFFVLGCIRALVWDRPEHTCTDSAERISAHVNDAFSVRSLGIDKHRANGNRVQERPQPKHENDHSKVHDQTLPVDSEEIYLLARFSVCRVARCKLEREQQKPRVLYVDGMAPKGAEPRQRRQKRGIEAAGRGVGSESSRSASGCSLALQELKCCKWCYKIFTTMRPFKLDG